MDFTIIDLMLKVIFDFGLLLILLADIKLYNEKRKFNDELTNLNKRLLDKNQLLMEQNRILKNKLHELCRRETHDE